MDYEEIQDAEAAIDNMDGAELLGRVLSCKFAKPMSRSEGKPRYGKAVWASEEYLEAVNENKNVVEEEEVNANVTEESPTN